MKYLTYLLRKLALYFQTPCTRRACSELPVHHLVLLRPKYLSDDAHVIAGCYLPDAGTGCFHAVRYLLKPTFASARPGKFNRSFIFVINAMTVNEAPVGFQLHKRAPLY